MSIYHMSEAAAYDFPQLRAFALAAHYAESNPLCSLDRVTDGYVAQEAMRLRSAATDQSVEVMKR